MHGIHVFQLYTLSEKVTQNMTNHGMDNSGDSQFNLYNIEEMFSDDDEDIMDDRDDDDDNHLPLPLPTHLEKTASMDDELLQPNYKKHCKHKKAKSALRIKSSTKKSEKTKTEEDKVTPKQILKFIRKYKHKLLRL